LSCAICTVRKEKRFCPAIHGRICPQCCGEQREVTLDCPSECVYLQQARAHEKPRGLANLEQSALFPQVAVSDRIVYEQEHLILGLSYALTTSARADRGIRDSDLIAALTALAKSYETLTSSGLHYEMPTANLAHQAVIAEVQKMVREYRETEQKHLGFSRVKDTDVLTVLVFLLRMALARTSGRPKSRAFIDFLFQQFPEQTSPIASAEQGSRLIVP
jgi:hypothetical protein